MRRWSPYVILACVVACSDPPPTPTESVCPPGSTLTYEDFAAPFMSAYCTRCHSSELSGSARMGAPSFHDFDTLAGILPVADHVDEWAAAGPAAVNTLMPPSGPSPSEAERRQLGEWLACQRAATRPRAGHEPSYD